MRPSSPAPVCRCGLSTGRAVGAAPPLAAAHRGFPGASATQLCPSAGHLSQGLLSGVGRWALPVRVPPNTPFSTPLPTCPPALPSPTWARERVQQSPRRRGWTGPFPRREGPRGCRAPAGAVLYSPAAGSSSSSRSGGSGAMGSGGRRAGPGSGAVLGGGACRCEPQRRWAGYKRLLSAPSRVPRSRSPSPSCAVHLARREELPLEEPARAGSCHSGSGARCRHRGSHPAARGWGPPLRSSTPSCSGSCIFFSNYSSS